MRELETQPEEMPGIAENPGAGHKRLGAVGKVSLAVAIAGGSVGGAYAFGRYLGEVNRERASADSINNNPSSTVFQEEKGFDASVSSESSVRIRLESDLENKIEEMYEIEILDIREAYRFMDKLFDPYDENEFGNYPPTRWLPEQIGLLGDLLPRLPEGLFKPLEGEKLNFSITDFGKDCPCAGLFPRRGLVLLSDESFKPEISQEAFRILTHELAHSKDDATGHALWPKVVGILDFPTFSEARNHLLPKLNEAYEKDDSLWEMHFNFNYGFNGLGDKGLNNPTEFIAELAETYVSGKKKFMQIRSFLGKKRAKAFYDLMKTEMFDGVEYDRRGRPID